MSWLILSTDIISWAGRRKSDFRINTFYDFKHHIPVLRRDICFLSAFLDYNSIIRNIQSESFLLFQNCYFLYVEYIDGSVFEISDVEIFISYAVFYMINANA